MKKKKKRAIRRILLILFSVVLALGLLYVYENYIQTPMIPSVKELIKEKKKNDFKDKDDPKIDVSTYVNVLPEARQAYGNAEIMGKLQVPNLNIDSWVTRTTNNEFYLDYNLYRQYDSLGVPFFDYRNYNLNAERQINIYGHNTTNEKYYSQLPFINLEAFVDKDIFNNYKDIYLSIDERQIHYEIIAVKIITESDNEHMKVVFYNDTDFLNHTAKMLQNTLYKRENIEITANDKLIVLQVCHYNPPNTYLLVIGKEVKV